MPAAFQRRGRRRKPKLQEIATFTQQLSNLLKCGMPLTVALGSMAHLESKGIPSEVSKLLKQLQRSGLVNSTRGTHGGYQLARAPEDITAAAILDALEGPIALTECSSGEGVCCIEHSCSVGRTWQRLNLAIRRSLSEISLAQLAGLDNRAPQMPIERELKHITRASKVPA